MVRNDEGGNYGLVRQDAWNQDEDLLLAEVVLRHIREGSTQLAAFEEVGEKLSRTPAACGFRWNSTIRKKYESAIQLAKKQRKRLKKNGTYDGNESSTELAQAPVVEEELEKSNILQSIDEMVRFLLDKKEELQAIQSQEDVVSPSRYKSLLEKNQSLEKDLMQLRHEYEMIRNDYELMINVMERASKRNQYASK